MTKRHKPRIRTSLLLINLAAVLATVSCAHAPGIFAGGSRGFLAGRVVAADGGAGIPGVRIVLRTQGVESFTDSAGSFALKLPSAAVDSITISHNGFATFTVPAIPLATRDTIHFEAMLLRNEARHPYARADCGPLFPPGQDCSGAASPYDGPIVLVDGVVISFPGPGVSHPVSNPPSRFIVEDVVRITVISGTAASTLFGGRAWHGTAIINTRACPNPNPARAYRCDLSR